MTRPATLPHATPAVVPFPEGRTLAEIDLAAWSCDSCNGSRPLQAKCTDWRECLSSNPRGKMDAHARAGLRAEQLAELLDQGECLKRAAHVVGVSEATAYRHCPRRGAA